MLRVDPSPPTLTPPAASEELHEGSWTDALWTTPVGLAASEITKVLVAAGEAAVANPASIGRTALMAAALPVVAGALAIDAAIAVVAPSKAGETIEGVPEGAPVIPIENPEQPAVAQPDESNGNLPVVAPMRLSANEKAEVKPPEAPGPADGIPAGEPPADEEDGSPESLGELPPRARELLDSNTGQLTYNSLRDYLEARGIDMSLVARYADALKELPHAKLSDKAEALIDATREVLKDLYAFVHRLPANDSSKQSSIAKYVLSFLETLHNEGWIRRDPASIGTPVFTPGASAARVQEESGWTARMLVTLLSHKPELFIGTQLENPAKTYARHLVNDKAESALSNAEDAAALRKLHDELIAALRGMARYERAAEQAGLGFERDKAREHQAFLTDYLAHVQPVYTYERTQAALARLSAAIAARPRGETPDMVIWLANRARHLGSNETEAAFRADAAAIEEAWQGLKESARALPDKKSLRQERMVDELLLYRKTALETIEPWRHEVMAIRKSNLDVAIGELLAGQRPADLNRLVMDAQRALDAAMRSFKTASPSEDAELIARCKLLDAFLWAAAEDGSHVRRFAPQADDWPINLFDGPGAQRHRHSGATHPVVARILAREGLDIADIRRANAAHRANPARYTTPPDTEKIHRIARAREQLDKLGELTSGAQKEEPRRLLDTERDRARGDIVKFIKGLVEDPRNRGSFN